MNRIALEDLERWSRTVRSIGSPEQAALIDKALESTRRSEVNLAVAAELWAWSMMEDAIGGPNASFAVVLRSAAAALSENKGR